MNDYYQCLSVVKTHLLHKDYENAKLHILVLLQTKGTVLSDIQSLSLIILKDRIAQVQSQMDDTWDYICNLSTEGWEPRR